MNTELLDLWASNKMRYVPDFPDDEPACEFAEEMAYIRQFLSPAELRGLAHGLGVSPDSLDALGAAWSGKRKAWAFPMLDADGATIGVRLRATDGAKWAITGSKQGLFYDAALLTAELDRVLYVCEGPTDTAAMLTMGYPAVGRASCNGQAVQVLGLCKRVGARRLVIVADNDTAKEKRDGSAFYPGREGAEKMAKETGLPFKLVVPPAKDIRAWLNDGASRDAFAVLERQMIWRK